ncbi:MULTISPECIES: sulfurtransferase-like selenium metabolism protein YedF [Clostridium]|uniref:Sulfurtransferase-like selenium metabolism protein YedF n=2 Tax=Clostridium cadaveris TaxID=1529 RepID=A0A316MC58_9CLOT|nr:sulfurtransferase-like selenium metabolism protein YedF [Clostridium cadaveris]MDU4952889.1 sulfurtransferase-like selenium metabolism protein YedF [Clostridium sp.]MDM8312552.1 sulfurtransferase-like selenium metabolism protein YedF [Clostridium cadaveris]MDY4949425.1 sulfurtransferase-like selenium metabolism protein YedF [Clostridium cadaveris]NWK12239.1 sulfurtransferase-like selenium metabolism protein YedF [Clostridium cadaveris]PWL54779.1 MAG: sulfurtransferase-like selenium metaboli
MMKIIDCKGLKCPAPVINTKKYFDTIEEGQAKVIVDNEVAKNNICKLADSNGFTYEVLEDGEFFNITITKESCGCEIMNFDKETAIIISSDKLGGGDEKLGETLMKSYLFALSESSELPTNLVFLNGGVKLVIEGSPCIESIEKISKEGVNILSCGTCLDFYGIKEKLAIGEITNMYTIVEIMNKAQNTIKL